MPTKRAARPTIITTITLTLVDESGRQFPIGKNGSPTFHQFKDWSEAQAAVVDMVATIGIETVHAMAMTLTQSQDGRLADFTATHYSRSEVAELCVVKVAKPGLSVTRADGRRVRVTVPTK